MNAVTQDFGLKVCTRCGKEKPRSEFYSDHRNRDGLKSWCRDCFNAAVYDYKKANPEKVKRWASKATKEQWAQWQRNHQPKKRARRKWRYDNDSEYRARRLEKWQQRRALLHGVAVGIVDRLAVYDRDGRTCHICGEHVRPKDFSIDHIIPISRGGEHSMANVATAHNRCNSGKGAR